MAEFLDVEWKDGDHDIDGETSRNIGKSNKIEGCLFEPEVPFEVMVDHWLFLWTHHLAEIPPVSFALLYEHVLSDVVQEK